MKHKNGWNITETDDYNWNWDINTVSGNTFFYLLLLKNTQEFGLYFGLLLVILQIFGLFLGYFRWQIGRLNFCGPGNTAYGL